LRVITAIIISLFGVVAGILIFNAYSYTGLVLFAGIVAMLEVQSYFLVTSLRRRFQWLITPKDEMPEIKKEYLAKFITHGYDPELGWIRKPNTCKLEHGRYVVVERDPVKDMGVRETMYHINERGARLNPGHEGLPALISCYGDSFTFCRQVNDDETWEWYLSALTTTNVLNFGVGNYGIDQALLRMQREHQKNARTKIVIMGVVPSTIVRILSVWKHYHEYGNIFGFTPRFTIEDGKLVLIENIMDREAKFYHLNDYIDELRKNDYFYETKFKKEMIRFPYFYSLLANPRRNLPLITFVGLSALLERLGIKSHKINDLPMDFIMQINLKLRYRLFKNQDALALLREIINEFTEYSKEQGYIPVLLWMPQKDDVLFVKTKEFYYAEFIKEQSKKLLTIDLTNNLVEVADLNELYSYDNVYGGHFSKHGNKFIGTIVYDTLKENKLLR
jgi:hypothetical protein